MIQVVSKMKGYHNDALFPFKHVFCVALCAFPLFITLLLFITLYKALQSSNTLKNEPNIILDIGNYTLRKLS